MLRNCCNIRSYCKIASLRLPVAPWDVSSTLGTLNTGQIAWPTIDRQVQNTIFMNPFSPFRERSTAIKGMVDTKMKILSLLVQCQFKSVWISSLGTKINQVRSVLWTGFTDSLKSLTLLDCIEHHWFTPELSGTCQGWKDLKWILTYILVSFSDKTIIRLRSLWI